MVGLVAFPFLYALYLSFHQVVGLGGSATSSACTTISACGKTGSSAKAVWLTIRFTVFSVFIKFWIGLGGGADAAPVKIKFRN